MRAVVGVMLKLRAPTMMMFMMTVTSVLMLIVVMQGINVL